MDIGIINMWQKLKQFFIGDKKNDFIVYYRKPTIPQAFDYDDELFERLTNELTFFIKPTDRITSFTQYIQSPLFEQYHLDLNNPNHAALMGYAFCLAITLAHELQQKTIIRDVLDTFSNHKVN